MPPQKATPLKFSLDSVNVNSPTPSNLSKGGSQHTSAIVHPSPNTTAAASAVPASTQPESISNPHELTAFVETVLNQLENNFDELSTQVLNQMSQMSSRIDSLENSIQELINGDIRDTSRSGS